MTVTPDFMFKISLLAVVLLALFWCLYGMFRFTVMAIRIFKGK